MSNNMILVTGGQFMMGADGWGEFESPVHPVTLDDFYISETSVTNAQFAEFVQATNYRSTAEENGFANGYHNGVMQKIAGLSWKTYYTEQRKDHPVVLVSWHDATAYAQWIGGSLPSEAQFEYAARGHQQGLYPWGNDEALTGKCNYGQRTFNEPATTAVKSFPPNGFGLYDMCGNVWNWCTDWFEETWYQQTQPINPVGPTQGANKARRGGSFNVIQPFRLRITNRGAYQPNHYAINIGFRCVKQKIQ